MSSASNLLAREFLTDVNRLCNAVVQRAEAREEEEEETHMAALGQYLVQGRGFILLTTLNAIIDQELTCREELLTLLLSLLPLVWKIPVQEEKAIDFNLPFSVDICLTKEMNQSSLKYTQEKLSLEENAHPLVQASLKLSSSIRKSRRQRRTTHRYSVRDARKSQLSTSDSEGNSDEKTALMIRHRRFQFLQPFVTSPPKEDYLASRGDCPAAEVVQSFNPISVNLENSGQIIPAQDLNSEILNEPAAASLVGSMDNSPFDLCHILLSLLEKVCKFDITLNHSSALTASVVPTLTEFLSGFGECCNASSAVENEVVSSGWTEEPVALVQRMLIRTVLHLMSVDINHTESMPDNLRKNLTDLLSAALKIKTSLEKQYSHRALLLPELLEGFLQILICCLQTAASNPFYFSQAMDLVHEFIQHQGFKLFETTVLQMECLVASDVGITTEASEHLKALINSIMKIISTVKKVKSEQLHQSMCTRKRHRRCEYSHFMHHHRDLSGLPVSAFKNQFSKNPFEETTEGEVHYPDRCCCIAFCAHQCLRLLQQAALSSTCVQILSGVHNVGICCCMDPKSVIAPLLHAFKLPILKNFQPHILNILTKFILDQLGGAEVSQNILQAACNTCTIDCDQLAELKDTLQGNATDAAFMSNFSSPYKFQGILPSNGSEDMLLKWDALEAYQDLVFEEDKLHSVQIASHICHLIQKGNAVVQWKLYNYIFNPVLQRGVELAHHSQQLGITTACNHVCSYHSRCLPQEVLQIYLQTLPALFKSRVIQDLFLSCNGVNQMTELNYLDSVRSYSLKVFETLIFCLGEQQKGEAMPELAGVEDEQKEPTVHPATSLHSQQTISDVPQNLNKFYACLKEAYPKKRKSVNQDVHVNMINLFLCVAFLCVSKEADPDQDSANDSEDTSGYDSTASEPLSHRLPCLSLESLILPSPEHIHRAADIWSMSRCIYLHSSVFQRQFHRLGGFEVCHKLIAMIIHKLSKKREKEQEKKRNQSADLPTESDPKDYSLRSTERNKLPQLKSNLDENSVSDLVSCGPSVNVEQIPTIAVNDLKESTMPGREENEWSLQGIRLLEALLAICLHSVNNWQQKTEMELLHQNLCVEDVLLEMREQLAQSRIVETDLAKSLFDSLLQVALGNYSTDWDYSEEKTEKIHQTQESVPQPGDLSEEVEESQCCSFKLFAEEEGYEADSESNPDDSESKDEGTETKAEAGCIYSTYPNDLTESLTQGELIYPEICMLELHLLSVGSPSLVVLTHVFQSFLKAIKQKEKNATLLMQQGAVKNLLGGFLNILTQTDSSFHGEGVWFFVVLISFSPLQYFTFPLHLNPSLGSNSLPKSNSTLSSKSMGLTRRTKFSRSKKEADGENLAHQLLSSWHVAPIHLPLVGQNCWPHMSEGFSISLWFRLECVQEAESSTVKGKKMRKRNRPLLIVQDSSLHGTEWLPPTFTPLHIEALTPRQTGGIGKPEINLDYTLPRKTSLSSDSNKTFCMVGHCTSSQEELLQLAGRWDLGNVLLFNGAKIGPEEAFYLYACGPDFTSVMPCKYGKTRIDYSKYISKDILQCEQIKELFMTKKEVDIGPLITLLEGCCSDEIININENGQFMLDVDSTAVIQDVKLLEDLLLDWKIWSKAQQGVWEILLRAIETLIRDNHHHQMFNIKQLLKARVAHHFLLTCQVLQEHREEHLASVPREVCTSFVKIIEEVLGSPPDLELLILIFNFLLAVHPPTNTYVCHNPANFYFSLHLDGKIFQEKVQSIMYLRNSSSGGKSMNSPVFSIASPTGGDSGRAESAEQLTLCQAHERRCKSLPTSPTSSPQVDRKTLTWSLGRSVDNLQEVRTSDSADPLEKASYVESSKTLKRIQEELFISSCESAKTVVDSELSTETFVEISKEELELSETMSESKEENTELKSNEDGAAAEPSLCRPDNLKGLPSFQKSHANFAGLGLAFFVHSGSAIARWPSLTDKNVVPEEWESLNFSSVSERTFQKPESPDDRLTEDCLVLTCCGLYALLRGVLLILPDSMLEDVMDKLIQPDTLIVLVNHPSPFIQQGVIKLLDAYFNRATREQKEKFLKNRGFSLLANQLYLHPGTRELSESFLEMLFGRPVGLDEEFDLEDVKNVGLFQKWCVIPVLGLMENSLYDSILLHNSFCLLLQIINSCSKVTDMLLDNGLLYVLCNTLAALNGLETNIPLNDYKLLVCDIQQLLVAVTIHTCSSSGSQYFRVIEDLVVLFGHLQNSKNEKTQNLAIALQFRVLQAAIELIKTTANQDSEDITNSFNLPTTHHHAMFQKRKSIAGPRKLPLDQSDTLLLKMRSVASDELSMMMQRRMSQDNPIRATETEFVQRLQRLTVLATNRLLYQDCYGVFVTVQRSDERRPETSRMSTPRQQWKRILWSCKETFRMQLGRLLVHALSPGRPLQERKQALEIICETNHQEILRDCLSPVLQDKKKYEAEEGVNKAAWEKTVANNRQTLFQRLDAKSKDISKTAGDITQAVSLSQGMERKKVIHHIRGMYKTDLSASRRWQELIQQLTHERALWYDPVCYPSSWQLDPTEGPNRERRRLQRCYLTIPNKYLLKDRQKQEEMIKSPLSYLFEDKTHSSHSSTVKDKAASEHIRVNRRCISVAPSRETAGELLLGKCGMYFVEDNASDTIESSSFHGETEPASFSWTYEEIKEVHKRWWQLRDNAVEIFLTNGRTLLLAFDNTKIRDDVYHNILTNNMPNLLEYGNITALTHFWYTGQITNFEYLTHLNKHAGRSFNDLMQYPVFPFILSDYTSETLDLNEPSVYRNLVKPIAVQSKEKEDRYVDTYKYLEEEYRKGAREDDPMPPVQPYHYGSHYSNSGTVLHFLVRMPPFTKMFLAYQDQSFDIPDRTFHSTNTTWRLSSYESMTDVKELIPEFFYLPEFLVNREGFDFGVRQNGERVNHVNLPPWARNDPRLFILIHRQALESDHVSQTICHWIDLVFGYKQKGRASVQAINVFHPATYFGMDVSAVEDPVQRRALETMIKTYGQTPRQLFHTAHVSRPGSRLVMEGELPAAMGLLVQFAFRETREHTKEIVYPSPLPWIKGLKWGEYVGSPSAPDPIVCFSQPHGERFGSLQALPTRAICGLSRKFCLLMIYSKEQGVRSMHSTDIQWSAILSWGYADNILRLKSKQSEPPVNFIQSSQFHEVTSCAWVPDSCQLFTGSKSGVITAYMNRFTSSTPSEMEMESQVHLYGHTAEVTSLFVCKPYSIMISVSKDGTCIIWDLNRLCYVQSLAGHKNPVTAVSASEMTGDIATVCDSVGGGSDLRLWTVNGDLVGHVHCREIICSVAFSNQPEGVSVNVIAGGLENGVVRLWSTWDLKPVREITFPKSNKPIVSLTFSCDGHHLYTANNDGTVIAWCRKDQQRLKLPMFYSFLSSYAAG
uniref:Lysosomal-trafficking regulator n=1 Tax=Sphenodon punctatus TaxID=8508 RepID=A0A8D0HE81_SPHPU